VNEATGEIIEAGPAGIVDNCIQMLEFLQPKNEKLQDNIVKSIFKREVTLAGLETDEDFETLRNELARRVSAVQGK
jgi:hypothetical protein